MSLHDNPEATWIDQFLERRGVERPDSRPLYAYRCSQAEASEVADRLRTVASRIGVGLRVTQCAMFCLFAAEWWRRNHAGGPWKWEGILDTLGWNGTALHRLYPVVEDGLGYWKRQLLKTGGCRGFLVTLACEGGLPLKLLRQEQSALRRYFHALLQDFQLYRRFGALPAELAAREAHLLRASLRQEVVYELSGNLVNAVWELQREVSNSSTPLADLDRRHPDWRDNLPVVVEDDTALALLNNLVEDAVKVAARRGEGFSLSRRLRTVAGSYRLEAEVRCPPSVESREFSQLVGVEGESLPNRLHLYVDSGIGGLTLLALASRVAHFTDDPHFVLEAPPGVQTERIGPAAVRGVALVAMRDGGELGRLAVTGGEELTDLPWAFVESSIEEQVFDYIGQGSARSRSPVVFVAVPATWVSQGNDLGTCDEAGQLETEARTLYRVTGSVVFADPTGEACRIIAGAEVDHVASYELRGPMLPVEAHGRVVYRGVPQLIERHLDGTPNQIPSSRLEWRSEIAGAVWKPLDSECVGAIRIRYVTDGVVRFRARALIVPSSASIHLAPNPDGRGGVINLSGFGTVEVGVTAMPNTEAQLTATASCVRVALTANREPPGLAEVQLRWRNGRSLDMLIPFPVKAGRFHARDGRTLRDEHMVAVDQLGGLCARVVDVEEASHYTVEGSLLCADVPPDTAAFFGLSMPLKQSGVRGWELDLCMLQDSIRSSLATSRDLDALFRLRLSGTSGIRPRCLFVQRFDADFILDRDTGEVALDDQESHKFTDEEINRFRIEAIPLWDPARDAFVLPRRGRGRWSFDPSAREVGPWLLLGWDGRCVRLRPTLWNVSGDGIAGDVEPGSLTLRHVVCLDSKDARRVSFDALLNELASRVEHPDWGGVYAYFEVFRYAPKSTLELFERLSEHAQAAALALLCAGNERFDLVWNAMEELPFCWELVPVASWLRAAETLVAPFRGLGTADEILTSTFAPFFAKAPRRAPGLRVIVELIHERILKRMPEEKTLIERAETPQGAVDIMRELESCERQLVSVHADDRWPAGASLSESKRNFQELPSWVESLWRKPPQQCGFRVPVLNAPVVAALGAVFGVRLDAVQVHNVRACRSFDDPWFRQAFCLSLAIAVSRADPGKFA